MPSRAGSCFYTEAAPEKQGKRAATEMKPNEAQHQRTLCRDGDGRSGRARGEQRARFRWPTSPQRQEISLSYLEQLFAKLRRGGLVKSVRGPGGGYRLSRPAGEVRIADIIVAVDEPIDGDALQAGQRQGLHRARRALRDPRSVGRTRPADPCVPVVGVARRRGREARARPHAALRRTDQRRPRERPESTSCIISITTRRRRCGPKRRPRWSAPCDRRQSVVRARSRARGARASSRTRASRSPRSRVRAPARRDLHQRRHRSECAGACGAPSQARWKRASASRGCSSPPSSMTPCSRMRRDRGRAGAGRAPRRHSRDAQTASSISKRCAISLREGKGRALVAVMAANNETGVIQPIAEVRDCQGTSTRCCLSMRCRRPARSRSTGDAIISRSRRTRSAARRASAR